MDLDAANTPDAIKEQIALGHALRELRRRAGLTQDELAAQSGADASYLSQVENGKRGVRWYTVMRLLRALNASLADLGTLIEGQDA